MTIIRDNSEDFEPPFANPEPDRESDTYKALTVNFSAEQLEFLVDIWMAYMDANVQYFDSEEFIKMDELWDLIKPGIVPGKIITPDPAA